MTFSSVLVATLSRLDSFLQHLFLLKGSEVRGEMGLDDIKQLLYTVICPIVFCKERISFSWKKMQFILSLRTYFIVMWQSPLSFLPVGLKVSSDSAFPKLSGMRTCGKCSYLKTLTSEHIMQGQMANHNVWVKYIGKLTKGK